ASAPAAWAAAAPGAGPGSASLLLLGPSGARDVVGHGKTPRPGAGDRGARGPGGDDGPPGALARSVSPTPSMVLCQIGTVHLPRARANLPTCVTRIVDHRPG